MSGYIVPRYEGDDDDLDMQDDIAECEDVVSIKPQRRNDYNTKHDVYIYTDSEWVGAESEAMLTDLADGLGISKVAAKHLFTQCIYIADDVRYRVLCFNWKLDEMAVSQAAEGYFDYTMAIKPSVLRSAGCISRLPGLEPHHNIIPVLYFAFLDLAYLVGLEAALDWGKIGVIVKRRAHSLTKSVTLSCGLTVVKVFDLFGLSPRGLEDFAEAVGFPTADKAESRKWDKSRMDIWAEQSIETLMPYMLWDVEALEAISERFPALVNSIRKRIGLPEDCKFRTMQKTIGSLNGNGMFHPWLKQQVPRLDEMQIALGLKLDPSDPKPTLKTVHGGVVDGARVSTLAALPGTLGYNAVVLGGRAVNERPAIHYVKGRMMDADEKSAYGSCLKDFVFPVGLPSVYGTLQDNESMTVGEFLAKHNAELVPGLWQIVIEGWIPPGKEVTPSYKRDSRGAVVRSRLGQNLLLGKRVDPLDIARAAAPVSIYTQPDDNAVDLDEDDIAKIPGLFALCTNKLEGALLEHETLQAISRVATNTEYAQFLGLRVKCAAWYAKSNMVSDATEFAERVLAQPGSYAIKDGSDTAEIVDTRSRLWHPVSLDGYSGEMVRMRGEVADDNKPLSNVIKLFVNSTYGVFASPYFAIGNAILANNITAKARLAAWLMAMALGGLQSITDGCAYMLDAVRYFDAKAKKLRLPGLTAFAELPLGDTPGGLDQSCRWTTKPTEGRYEGSLRVAYEGLTPWEPGGDTKANVKAFCKVADAAALAHVNAFWANYDSLELRPTLYTRQFIDTSYRLQMPMAIEHKWEHTATKWATTGKTDYAFDSVFGSRTYKLRGAKDWRLKDGCKDMQVNYRYRYLDAVLNEAQPPTDYENDVVKLVSLPMFNRLRPEQQSATFPGLEVRSRTTYRYKPNNVPLPDMDAHAKWADITIKRLDDRSIQQWLSEPDTLAKNGMLHCTFALRRDNKLIS